MIKKISYLLLLLVITSSCNSSKIAADQDFKNNLNFHQKPQYQKTDLTLSWVKDPDFISKLQNARFFIKDNYSFSSNKQVKDIDLDDGSFMFLIEDFSLKARQEIFFVEIKDSRVFFRTEKGSVLIFSPVQNYRGEKDLLYFRSCLLNDREYKINGASTGILVRFKILRGSIEL